MNIRSIYPPNTLFQRVSPFIPTFRYRFFETNDKLLLRDFPLTLYERTAKRRIRWIGFIYAFLYINKKEERVLRLERLHSFLPKRVWQRNRNRTIYDQLLNECITLSKYVRADFLEFEAYKHVGGDIYFPSTLSFVDSHNDPDIFDSLQKVGFQQRATEYAFVLPSHTLKNPEPVLQHVIIKKYEGSLKEKKSYWSLWSKSVYCPEHFSEAEPRWDLHFGVKSASDPRFVFFAWKNEQIIGFAHWLPNYYQSVEMSWRTRDVARLSSQSMLEGGKIFKMIVDPDHDSHEVRRSLCLRVLRAIHEYGLRKVQIGNIKADDKIMLKVIEELDGRQLHVLHLLVKKPYQ